MPGERTAQVVSDLLSGGGGWSAWGQVPSGTITGVDDNGPRAGRALRPGSIRRSAALSATLYAADTEVVDPQDKAKVGSRHR
jgi:hypothetical protein